MGEGLSDVWNGISLKQRIQIIEDAGLNHVALTLDQAREIDRLTERERLLTAERDGLFAFRDLIDGLLHGNTVTEVTNQPANTRIVLHATVGWANRAWAALRPDVDYDALREALARGVDG